MRHQTRQFLSMMAIAIGVVTLMAWSGVNIPADPVYTAEGVLDRLFSSHDDDSNNTGAGTGTEFHLSRPTEEDDKATCGSWDPIGLAEDDPPNCLRAKQFRQIQEFRKNSRYEYEPDVWEAVKDLESCALGYTHCPSRPLIVSGWWYMYNGVRKGVSGEEIWMKSVAYYIRKEGFILMSTFKKARAIHLTRALSHSVHMFWTQDAYAFECTTNPRCISSEDYYPAENITIRHDLDKIPDWEMGSLPLWRIFATTYWGARPNGIGAPGINAWYDWRLPENETEWSYNPLGRQMVISPYPYPGHSWVPLSMERDCLQTPPVPHNERDNSVLILAKESNIFNQTGWTDTMIKEWPQLAAHLKESSNHQFSAYAKINPGFPLPEGIVNHAQLSKLEYQQAVSSAKVMLGINRPEISPSPYLALCRGVPVVLPYKGDTPTPEGWKLYERKLVQHGPLNTIGEPYVYTYNIDDMEDMKAKIDKAINTPIHPFVPAENTERAVVEQVRKMLYHDYQGDYELSKKMNGGLAPKNPEYMRERCFELGTCRLGPQPE